MQRPRQRPASSPLRQEVRRVAGDVSDDAAAEQSPGQHICSQGAGAGLGPGLDPAPADSLDRAVPAGCSRAEPWPRAPQQSEPCEPLYSPMLRRRADAERQRQRGTAAGSSAPSPPPDAMADLNVTEPLRSFDPEAAVQQPQPQMANRDPVPEQPLPWGLPAGVHPSREHLFRHDTPPPGNQQQQRRRAASSSARALEAAQAAARRALASGVKAALDSSCKRCGGSGHSYETCRFSDKTARKRRKKAKLAAKAAREAAKAAAPTACAATAADGVPLPEQQRAKERKRKPKGVSRAFASCAGRGCWDFTPFVCLFGRSYPATNV